MEELFWEQKNDNVFITVEYKNKNIKFKLDDRIIIHLIGNSPKIYYFSINIGGETQDFLANFSDLKPIIKSSGKLKLTVNSKTKSNVSEVSTFGTYTIARGESFYERFLGVKDWQSQEYLFNLVPLSQQDVVKKVEEKTQPTHLQETKVVEKIEEKTFEVPDLPEIITPVQPIKEEKSKFLECPSCGSILSSDYDFCPHCFKATIKPEQGVDFAI
ncbi:MAG: hypothetical protein JXL97_15130 [Bacteroidales bacterium]|nr:hypothetical protein [Bacteroidales bacterium]